MTVHNIGKRTSDNVEWDLRVNLAACYRLMARFGWTDLIYTHVSARLPGKPDRFLINPYGMMFEEITASSLLAVDFGGKILDDSPWTMNDAGFVIHSGILMARPDVNCVLHTHTTNGVAVSCLKDGLLPISQFALFYHGRIAYHDYEGVACDLDERQRLAADLGDKPAMILRNHGLLTAGRSIGEAFVIMDQLEKSCAAQLAAQRTGGELLYPSSEVCEKVAAQAAVESGSACSTEWDALLRMLDRVDPSYRQ